MTELTPREELIILAAKMQSLKHLAQAKGSPIENVRLLNLAARYVQTQNLDFTAAEINDIFISTMDLWQSMDKLIFELAAGKRDYKFGKGKGLRV